MYYKRFENCLFVRGANRSCIYDMQRESYKFVPNEIEDLWNQLENGIPKKEFENLDPDLIDFLIQNEFVFQIDKSLINQFPKLQLDFDSSSLIDTIVIDALALTEFGIEELSAFNQSLEKLIVNNLLIHNVRQIEQIEGLLKSTEDSRLLNIGLIIPEKPSDLQALLDHINQYRRVGVIYVNFELSMSEVDVSKYRFSIQRDMEDKTRKSLITNIELLVESQSYNSYYNKKLFIDKDGFLTNSKMGEKRFGRFVKMKHDELMGVISNDDFQYYWSARKDTLDVCADCEFRYMCIDKRIPKKRTNQSSWYFEKECNYNPYISKWVDEDGYKSLEECGVVSNEEGLTIIKERIEILNNELWDA